MEHIDNTVHECYCLLCLYYEGFVPVILYLVFSLINNLHEVVRRFAASLNSRFFFSQKNMDNIVLV